MSILITLAVFAVSMLTCIILNISLAYALAVTVIAFFILGIVRGFYPMELIKMTKERLREVCIILRIFIYIGILTAIWRSCGTISFFIYYGIELITPSLFILIAFLLPAILSYAIGTSFGVAGTAGIIIMALARTGGVNEIITAGAVISGCYFGDRCAPTSSCANLITAITGTDIYSNVKYMMKTGAIPVLLTVIIYAVLSASNPINTVDESFLTLISSEFDLSFLTVLPALVMIVLPLLKVPVRLSMLISVIVSFVISLTLQGDSIIDLLKYSAIGYTPENGDIAAILSGGGLISMVEASIIITLTSILTGIIEGTGILNSLEKILYKISRKIGRFGTISVLSLLISSILCNQTVTTMLDQQLMSGIYEKDGASKQELSTDISNSGAVIPVLIPWNIAAAIPLAMLEASSGAIIYAFLIYLIPICYLFTKRLFFKVQG